MNPRANQKSAKGLWRRMDGDGPELERDAYMSGFEEGLRNQVQECTLYNRWVFCLAIFGYESPV
ncbi:MAG TPA: hypothetical protein VLZ10_03595 [Thermodesulfobacteriota bacterium]|nr:hypothetical protein [Thermodesulfobacteriota bacterium]